jgi:uncharacterized repeat protein (TIGR03806 family)
VIRALVQFLVLCAAGVLAGGRSAREPVGWGSRAPLPRRLSETGFFSDLKSLTPSPRLVPYELNATFWSDGASKQRWFLLPEGAAFDLTGGGQLQIPPGTIAVKNFETPAASGSPQRLETRVLIYDGQGAVHGAAYHWRDDLSEADVVTDRAEVSLRDAALGDLKTWHIPSSHDCLECHTPQAGGFLGLTAPQLNRDAHGPAKPRNQLERWREAGIVKWGRDADPVAMPDPSDAAMPLAARARAYLDANCANCHRPGGVATDFDLRLSTPLEQQRILDFRPRIDLALDGARLIAPGDPWRSAILARMQRLDSNGMPPLAHQAVDERGAAMIRSWVESLPGRPSAAPPRLSPESGDSASPVTVTISAEPGATIRYTLDGSSPRSTSPLYEHPLVLDHSATVRARSYAPGLRESIVSTATYVISIRESETEPSRSGPTVPHEPP